MVANYLLKAHLTKKRKKLIDNSLNHLQEIIKMETDLLPLYKKPIQRSSSIMKDLIIIGAGPCGLAAAVEAQKK